MLANVSHEIKNPVYGILNFIEGAYKLIEENGKNLNNIIPEELTTHKTNDNSVKK